MFLHAPLEHIRQNVRINEQEFEKLMPTGSLLSVSHHNEINQRCLKKFTLIMCFRQTKQTGHE
jgi:hypothetical protein